MVFVIWLSKEVGEVLGKEKVRRQSSSLRFQGTLWKKLFPSDNFELVKLLYLKKD